MHLLRGNTSFLYKWVFWRRLVQLVVNTRLFVCVGAQSRKSRRPVSMSTAQIGATTFHVTSHRNSTPQLPFTNDKVIHLPPGEASDLALADLDSPCLPTPPPPPGNASTSHRMGVSTDPKEVRQMNQPRTKIPVEKQQQQPPQPCRSHAIVLLETDIDAK